MLRKGKKRGAIEFDKMIAAIIVLILAIVIIWGVIHGIFGKQIRDTSTLSDKAILDYDDDGLTGLLDKCPCDPYLKPDEKGECKTPKKECDEKIESKKAKK